MAHASSNGTVSVSHAEPNAYTTTAAEDTRGTPPTTASPSTDTLALPSVGWPSVMSRMAVVQPRVAPDTADVLATDTAAVNAAL